MHSEPVGSAQATDTPVNLSQLIEQLSDAVSRRDQVRLEDVVHAVGDRSFAPLLLVAGLAVLSPLSGIPGMPTSMAIVVLLVCIQLICRRRHFWLPRWLLKRSVSRRRYEQALGWLRPSARLVDRFLRPRLQILVRNVGVFLILSVCIVIALAMPMMEPVPFAATIAGAALTGFGLALLARDGVVALISLIVTLTAGWIIVDGVL